MATTQPALKDYGYEDLKVIGRGQYGKAHLVRSEGDEQYYIAKTIDLTCLSSKERETAKQEVALLSRLNHPNIVSYKDNFFMGANQDTLVIIMQYCEGGDLATYIKDMLKKKTRIDEYQIMHYFVQILQALQYIHGERILHRDLKTSNLFLMKSKSVVKLGDFGISRVLEGSIEAAITVVGTPYYMSPEVCENKPYTFKSDVWSLGCCLYELCMLKHAFSADNLLGLVYKIVSDKYEPIPERYTPQLNTLIQRMLEKNAEQRPSVRDLLADSYVQSFMNAAVQNRHTSQSTADGPSPAPPGGVTLPRSSGSVRSGASQGPPERPPFAPAEVQRGIRPGQKPVRQTGRTAASRAAARASETPKEAAARRKREAADRKAEQMKMAAKQSMHNKTVARQMREAEFQTTLASGLGAAATSPSPPSPPPGGFGAGGPAATSGVSASPSPTASPMHFDDEIDEDEPLEEIDESDYSEEYEDDFEDAPYSEDEDEAVMSDIEEVYMGPGAGALSIVREEEDLSRVMNNYEQDLARNSGSASPAPSPTLQPRRTGSLDRSPVPPPPVPGSAIMDMRSRASRLKEELICKMGQETFEKAFNFLYNARMKNADQRSVKRDLEALVGRQVYKDYCFDVDQLVFQQLTYGGT
ncbi:NEK4 [Symbiodinium microadriaticum]|nr:NEK4 [Symbiodinium microadriaticum]CAE7949309.1 NEK4 [Symbiodinium sp. KB8]